MPLDFESVHNVLLMKKTQTLNACHHGILSFTKCINLSKFVFRYETDSRNGFIFWKSTFSFAPGSSSPIWMTPSRELLFVWLSYQIAWGAISEEIWMEVDVKCKTLPILNLYNFPCSMLWFISKKLKCGFIFLKHKSLSFQNI